MMFRGTAAELQGLQVAQDAQREEQKAAQELMVCTGTEAASNWLSEECLTTITITGGGGLGGYGGGSTVPDGYEARHGQPTDAPEAVDIGELTVQFEAQQQRGRSLMGALAAMDRSWRSDGKPPRYEFE